MSARTALRWRGEPVATRQYRKWAVPAFGVICGAACFIVAFNIVRLTAVPTMIVSYAVSASLSYWLAREWAPAVLWPSLTLVPLAIFAFPPYQLLPIPFLAIAALGTNIVTGYAGQISVAQGTFIGIGAYATALLMVRQGWPFFATIPVAAVAAGVAGLIIAVPSARLSGVYQVMTTLALAVGFPDLVIKFQGFTGGNTGINLVSTPSEPGWLKHLVTLSAGQYQYLLSVILLGIVLFVAWNLIRRYPGRAMRALRDNDVAAAVVGVNVARYKVFSFAVSAAFGGIAGSLYAITTGVVVPGSFGLFYSIQFLVMVVVGGLSTLSGGILGAVFLWELTQRVGQVTIDSSGVTISDQVIYGIVLILALIFVRQGITSLLRDLGSLLDRLIERIGRRPGPNAVRSSPSLVMGESNGETR